MNKFNLTQLRHDVIDHADLPASIWSESSSYVTSWIDFIVEALIGSDYYNLMILNPGAMIKFPHPTLIKFTDGQYMCMFHDFTK